MKNIIIKTIKVTAILLVAFVVLVGASKAIGSSISASERMECLKMEKEAVEYGRKYFVAKWQDDMCRTHGIFINAEVK